MTSSHIIFIPGMIMIGMFLGFILGNRAAKNQMELLRRREAEREAARAARAAKRDGAKPDGAKPDGAKPDGAKPDGAKRDGAKPDGAKSFEPS